jgi:hypothetical protein
MRLLKKIRLETQKAYRIIPYNETTYGSPGWDFIIMDSGIYMKDPYDGIGAFKLSGWTTEDSYPNGILALNNWLEMRKDSLSVYEFEITQKDRAKILAEKLMR